MVEWEGRCPLHEGIGRAMPRNGEKNLTCDGKNYEFPYRLYYCRWHGYWIWRARKNTHELFDFVKYRNRAQVTPLPPESPDTRTLTDYLIVKMKCTEPECRYEWRQYDKTETTDRGGVFCPSCRVEIPKEEAVKERS